MLRGNGRARAWARARIKALAAANGGRRGLAILVVILLLGLGLRVGYAWRPWVPQDPDARAYARIAQSLYTEGRFSEQGNFTPADIQSPNNYSPGLPLFVAGIYYATGGVHLQLARLILAVIGWLSVPLAYLLGRRLAGPVAGLVAALGVAIYPALLQYQGMLMTEPLGATLLCAALLAFLWAVDRGSVRAFAAPGLLLGALAMVRPEYLLFGALLPALGFALIARRGRWRMGLASAALMVCAFLLPIVPWTVRNVSVFHRLVPISTGAGKVLFIGNYPPAAGDQTAVKQELLEHRPRLRRRLAEAYQREVPSRPTPWLLASQRTLPAQGISPQIRLSQRLPNANFIYLESVLNALAARRYPGVSTDVALSRMGMHALSQQLGDPLGFVALGLHKVYDSWRVGPRHVMAKAPWRQLHTAIVIAALLGLCLLAWQRRFEALLIGLVLIGISAVCALLIPAPRRVIVLLPLICALAGAAVSLSAARLAAWRSPERLQPA